MIPSVTGNIKTNYIQFRGKEDRESVGDLLHKAKDERDHLVEGAVAATGIGATTANSVAPLATNVTGKLGTMYRNLKSTKVFVKNSASAFSRAKNAIMNGYEILENIKFLKIGSVFKGTKFAAKGFAGFFGGVFALATAITGFVNIGNFAVKIEDKN